MAVSLLVITIGIAAIILLTTKVGVHPFFALLVACFFVGLGIGLPPAEVLAVSKDGFGNILKSLGFIVVLGTTLGLVLEHTGATEAMASFLIQKLGAKRTPLAMSLTGFIVGLPVFCDSGFIVLSGLNHALARRTSLPASTLAIAMATGLYSVHCLLPPHPGATAAAATIGVDYGKLILIGLVVAVPAMFAGYAWTVYAGKKTAAPVEKVAESDYPSSPKLPAAKAFLPVLIPVVLIALKSTFSIDSNHTTTWLKNLLVLGDPVPALLIGILLALVCKPAWKRSDINKLLAAAVEKAGSILVIIGAGGAFGAVLTAAKLGEHMAGMGISKSLALLALFLLAVVLKTAQGSSTVAIITASAIARPLLPGLGIGTDTEKLLAVLAMGAGSMALSHANDAYFWVISKFSDTPAKTVLNVYTTATVVMALTSLAVIYTLYWLL